MIYVKRLAEPAKLVEKKKEWLETFLKAYKQGHKKRPQSSKYAHEEIRDVLWTMSFGKCFYCEQNLKETKAEVGHYIEVAEKPEDAFAWQNLYLSCQDCNRKKKSNLKIPVNQCLDPCDNKVDPKDHLVFEDELIRPKTGSSKGAKTIQKYGLDRPELDYQRIRQLRLFDELLIQISDNLRRENRSMNEKEREAILSFQERQRPFSLMFHYHLDSVVLLKEN